MGVCLYRDGDQITVRGVRCERILVDSRSVNSHLALGWRLSPENDSVVESVDIADKPDDADLHPAVAERKRRGRPSLKTSE